MQIVQCNPEARNCIRALVFCNRDHAESLTGALWALNRTRQRG